MLITPDTITMLMPVCKHMHFRQGKAARAIMAHFLRQCCRGLAMPNTVPPILSGADAVRYAEELMLIAAEAGYPDFKVIKCIQITDGTTPDMIRVAHALGVAAGKIYPMGVTTNSHNGVTNFRNLFFVFRAMQECGMLLLLHGQTPDAEVMKREQAFLPTLRTLAKEFTSLRIVMEHLSTVHAANEVLRLPDTVGATITAHHLVLTLDDILASSNGKGKAGLNPYHYCQPVPQPRDHRDALISIATSGDKKIFFGSDSAWHPKHGKESCCGSAGVHSAPSMIPVLVKVFSEAGQLPMLEKFTSVHGPQFYGDTVPTKTLTLIRKNWTVPEECDDTVPLFAGQTLEWQVAA